MPEKSHSSRVQEYLCSPYTHPGFKVLVVMILTVRAPSVPGISCRLRRWCTYYVRIDIGAEVRKYVRTALLVRVRIVYVSYDNCLYGSTEYEYLSAWEAGGGLDLLSTFGEQPRRNSYKVSSHAIADHDQLSPRAIPPGPRAALSP